MRDLVRLEFSTLKVHKMASVCQYSMAPLLCHKRWILRYREVNGLTDPNSTGLSDDDYYDFDEDYQYPLFIPMSPQETFIKYLYMIAFPYLLLFGTIGNIISMHILQKYSHNVWSTCLYMAMLFPMDLVKLYIHCGNDWYKKIHDDMENLSADILHLSNAVCKVYNFTYYLLLHEAEWIMVALGIEMAIAMLYPLRIYKMCTRERATAIMLFISVVLISLNLHFFWTYGMTRPDDDPAIDITICTYINELSDRFRDYIWPLITFIIGKAIPLCILLTCITVATLGCWRKRNKKTQDELLVKYFLDIKTLYELRVSMFVVIIIAILNTSCGVIETGLVYFSNVGMLEIEYETYQLTMAILLTLTYIFMSHKFWIFYICCRKFREDVKEMGKCLCSPILRKYYKVNNRHGVILYKSRDDSESWPGESTLVDVTADSCSQNV